MNKLRLGFFASHGGSNMQAIIDACKSGELFAEPAVCASNNSKSRALERCRAESIPAYHVSSKTHPDPKDYENALIEILERHFVDTICLAGFMKKLPDAVLERFNGRVLNIHPALLPKFGGKGMYGLNVHKAVLEARESRSGATVHLVSSEYDRGKILARREAPVLPDDTPESLAARVLEIEHEIYPETLQKIALGEIII